ncbi:choice-of-anchor D domain-containing protein [Hymenobacter sp. BT683]|uniref:Choice-of-anchor D domain-containing protein n=1 Tax=Hymenobacter jeongseonensis TaxID=2791027 RepID=A0ABS0IHA7_9BACT|nr:choice-of-anchor D domain-containing protein [Hymenobacter jeongseonensis]MBF9237741.1 choice-of-anchor D domain-containing protein [Hymenobacter jeongseonensis]
MNFGTALDNKTGPIFLRIVTIAGSGGSGNRPTTGLDDFTLSYTTTPPPTTPTISVSAAAFTTFSTTAGTASASQSYTVSGTNLTANISIVAPTGYELALESATPGTPGTFAAHPVATPLVLTQAGGSVASTRIYVRLASTTTVAGSPYSGSLAHSSTDATTVNKTVSGTVTAPVPAPTITTFTPPNGPVGTVVTINGTNFISGGTTVKFNSTTATAVTFVSTSQITATVPTGATTGPITVTVSGNATTATSATDFTVDPTPNPVPTISSLSPSSALAGSAGFTLTVNGTGFVSAAVTTFTFGGTSYAPNATGFGSSSFTVAIPAAAIATAGPKTVTVTNPAPGGGTATSTFTVLTPPLATYSTASLSGSATSVSPASTATNITASTITRGFGLGTASATGGYNSSNWNDTPTLIPTEDFLAYSITVGTGFQASISGVTLIGQRTSAGPQTLELRYSTDGTNFSNPVSLGTGTLPNDGTEYSFTFSPAAGTLQAVYGTLHFRLYGYNATSSGNFNLRNSATSNALTVNGTVAVAVPGTIVVSTNGPLSVGTTQQLVPSAPPVSYTVSGSSLGFSQLTVQAPAGFQVSTTAAFTGVTGDANSVNLTPTGGVVSNTTIYVRLSGSGTVGPLAGNIVHTSGISPVQNVAVTGTLNIAPPTIGVSHEGTGIAAGGSFTFPDTRVEVRNTQTFTVSNTGGEALLISSISTTGTDFAAVGVLPTVVPAFSTATFAVRFEPTVVGVRTGTLTLVSNDPARPNYVIALSGTGLASTFVRWTGAGGNNSFFTATNWSTGAVPGASDDVLLDHSTVTGAYLVSMSGTGTVAVTLRSLTLNPGGASQPTIELEVPDTNPFSAALTITAASSQPSLSIYANAIVTNRTLASSAAGILITGNIINAYIYDGGTYQHATPRSSSDLTDNLSGVGGTENGTFVYNVIPSSPGQIISPALQGRFFGNLTFLANDPSGYTANGSSPLTINGALTVQVGTQFLNDISITNLRGNIVNSGNLRFTGTELNLDGQAPQIISGKAFGSSTASNNSGFGTTLTVAVNNPTGLTLNTNVQINGGLNLMNGVVTTSATHLLTIATAATITGGSATSFVSGPLARATGTGAASVVFPIGKEEAYRPLTLTITAQTGATTYTAEQVEGNPGQQLSPFNLIGGARLTRVSSIRSFTLSSSDAATSGTSGRVTLSFGSDDFVNNPNDPGLVVAGRTPAFPEWQSLGRSGATGTTGPGAIGTVTSTTIAALTSPATFAIGSTNMNNPLPVELSSFTAKRQGSNAVMVKWTTASEQNSAYFEVQRSLDGRQYTTVAKVQAQGNSSQLATYASLDGSAPAGTLYYRLFQADTDGKTSYSPVLTVSGSAIASKVLLFPNPAHSSISFMADAATPYRVLNQLSQSLLRGTTEAGTAKVAIDALAPGIYFLELQTATGRVVLRFEKQ